MSRRPSAARILWRYTFSLFRRLRGAGVCCTREDCPHEDQGRFRYAASVTGMSEEWARALARSCFAASGSSKMRARTIEMGEDDGQTGVETELTL